MTYTDCHFTTFKSLNTHSISRGRQHGDRLILSLRTKAAIDSPLLYKLLLSTLAPCEIQKRYPLTSCVLISFLHFPCGTHIANISQLDNSIFKADVQVFCFSYHLLLNGYRTRTCDIQNHNLTLSPLS